MIIKIKPSFIWVLVIPALLSALYIQSLTYQDNFPRTDTKIINQIDK